MENERTIDREDPIRVILSVMVFFTAIATGKEGLGQVTQEWVARYNGPGNSVDGSNAMAVDGTGNVYVTGVSTGSGTGSDYATVKYDANGNQLWVAHYNGPGNGPDVARALVGDSGGNVYVTGASAGSGTGSDYATIKYDADGTEVWVARYNGPGNFPDSARALVVDSGGNVYVTGSSYGSATSYDNDYTTIKYDADGTEVWVARYNGPGDFFADGITRNSLDEAKALAVDASGHVYVTGSSPGSGTGNDYATIKYDADGTEVWVARYNGPANVNDDAIALAVDGADNVYVTGSSYDTVTRSDYTTIKYDANGNELWVVRYNGPESLFEEATALLVDASGHVYVTGSSYSNAGYDDYATVSYDADGNQMWAARYNGPGNSTDRPKALAVDGSGHAYVTGGSFDPGTNYDYATIKYDADGTEVWVVRYNGPANSTDDASGLGLDGSGHVYVAGGSVGLTTGYDYTTIQYSQILDADNDGVPDSADRCPEENATGLDADGDGCIDSFTGLTDLVNTLVEEGSSIRSFGIVCFQKCRLLKKPRAETISALR